ncbi:MAG TPA: DUF4364 family protein [Thermoclostridium sp.]
MSEHLDIAEKKILILYFFKVIDMPVGSMQFVRIMLENRLINYFYMQQYLSELIEEKLVTAEKKDGISYYTITEKGSEVLDMFESILPAGLKKLIKDSTAEIRNKIRTETMITADYIPEGDGYTVLCKIRENDFSLMEVKIAAGTKEDARNICKNWTSFPQEIYLEILDTMIRNREKNPQVDEFVTDDQK